MLCSFAAPIALVACFAAFDNVHAQSPTVAPQFLHGWGAGYLAAGVSVVSTAALDHRLEPRLLTPFGRNAATLGIGAYLQLPRSIIIGGEATGLTFDQRMRDGQRVGLGGGYATLGIGYIVDVSPRMRVYPRVGVGIGGIGLSISRAEVPVDFDDALDDPERYDNESGWIPSVSANGAVLDVGAGAEYWPSKRGLLLGFRAGYLVTPGTWSWSIKGREVTNGPSASIAGLYLRVMVGAGPWW